MANNASIELTLGGIYKDGIMIAGRVATISDNVFSSDLFKSLSSIIKKNFKKVGAFYVGEEAIGKLKSGWRLVTNERSPMEYDLKI
jgi:hypothetical protein